MHRSRIERAKRPVLPATASSVGIGFLRLGSEHFRAAVRALIAARQDSEADGYWDGELDCSGLADRLKAAREKKESREQLEEWKPILIPPRKENTARGKLAARINTARARMRQYEAG
jgi:hypothetical protein